MTKQKPKLKIAEKYIHPCSYCANMSKDPATNQISCIINDPTFWAEYQGFKDKLCLEACDGWKGIRESNRIQY